jgi:hypothetical protein
MKKKWVLHNILSGTANGRSLRYGAVPCGIEQPYVGATIGRPLFSTASSL